MIQTVPYEIKDFSGGMTDYYVGALPNRYEIADNFLIEKHGNVGKLVQRPGSEVYSYGDEDSARTDQIPAGSQRINALLYFADPGSGSMNSRRLQYISATHAYSNNLGGSGNGTFYELTTPDSAAAFPNATVNSTYSIAFLSSNEAIVAYSASGTPKPIFIDIDANAYNVGLPRMASSPTPTSGTAGTTFSYLYRFSYVHADSGVRGSYREVAATNNTAIDAGAANTISWAGIVALGSGAYRAVTKEIYRTTNGGTVFYLVATIADATTTYADTMTDATLLTQEPMYTEGGLPESREPPPGVLHVHSCNKRTYYGNCLDPDAGNLRVPQRLYQSMTGSQDYVPADWFIDLDQGITGLSSVKDIPVVLCDRGNVYRIDGFIDDLGGGDMVPQIISTDHACVGGMSVVQAAGGVFWAGTEGFCYTDGYTVMLVSEGLRKTYRTFTNTIEKRRRIVGTFHEGENRIYWTAQVGDSATDCNTLFVLDLNWGISSDMPFTTWSGGTNFAPTAVAVVDIAYDNYQGVSTLTKSEMMLIRGDTRGYALRHKAALRSDHKIDASVGAGNALDLWENTAITVNYVSAALDMGTSGVRKWVPSMTVVCKNEGDLSLQINSDNDDGRKTGVLKPIRFRDGDQYTGMIDEFRRFPAGSMRCEFKQVQFTSAYVVITSSDETGVLCDVNGAANTATIVSGTWPTEALEYYISFSTDSYVTEYLVTGRTDTVLTFTDAGNVAPTTDDLGWVLRGYPRDEYVSLYAYTLNYAVLSQTQAPFASSTTGEP